ncbi:phosphoethanolamine transferase [Photobacterium sp. TY1-4]|uniref:phosphoethanolamine transferase n=1 Tax=Photobacterium sp. TY1-4 TaxID=2899122 RepID=UPI0021BF8798|nr:phosphoethanolamine--lipid A transferase [Photobacterium sp. TY1-4]UXI02173.1 phosphoethanolamine--lipid A transferase [Photobacterium sp. TY1-4]
MMDLVFRWKNKLTQTTMSSTRLTLLLSVSLVLFYNLPLWQEILSLHYEMNFRNLVFFISLFVFLVSCFNVVLLLIALPYIQKPLTILICISAAFAAYFMDAYGIMIDRTMIQNTLETDPGEVFELLSLKMLLYFLVFGLIPAVVIYCLNIQKQSLGKEVVSRLVSGTSSFIVVGLIAFTFYQDYASLFRNNRHLRYLLNPSNYIYASVTYLSNVLDSGKITIQPIALDARRESRVTSDRKSLTILVVGETARAANFSFNGYDKNTNPQLSQQDIINFSNVSSCGTSTAVSLPCMFSHFDRTDYSRSEAKQYEGLLDVLARVGVDVLWRENNSGCKGVCDRVFTEELSQQAVSEFCRDQECLDEILLHRLEEYIDNLTHDAFIVLHQKGSHGPAYYRRYPQGFEKFIPVCRTNQLQDCTRQEITNAYDNSILYTDHFLNKVIEFLKQRSKHYDTAMIYLSDHGESLGENNMYLHGTGFVD